MSSVVREKFFPLAFSFLFIIAFAALRFVNLGADTPPGLPQADGIYVDEGYKTLGPRNLVLFGATRIHPHDPYEGWMDASPLTQWLYYGAFRRFGARVESARMVTATFFSAFLGIYVWAMRNRYEWYVFLGGLAALGLDYTLFIFSRTALFEIPVTALLYSSLFVLARRVDTRPATVLVFIAGTAIGLSIFVKLSSLIYFCPVFIASMWFFTIKQNWHRRRGFLLLGCVCIFACICLLGVLIPINYTLLSGRLEELTLLSFVENVLGNPLTHTATVVVVAGLFCCIHSLLCMPRLFCQDLYRVCLLCLICVAPMGLAVFPYSPLRYYVPVLPAYVLVALEWIQLRGWRQRVPRAVPAALQFLFLGAIVVLLFYVLNGFLFPGILRVESDFPTARVGVPIAVVLALVVWRWRFTVFHSRVASQTMLILPLVWSLQNFTALGSFFLSPQYEAERIRRDLPRFIGKGESLAGNYAPFFAVGTPIRAFYMFGEALGVPKTATGYRSAKSRQVSQYLKTMKPDFWLYSDDTESREIIEAIRGVGGVCLTNPVYRSSYNEWKIILYPVCYGSCLEPEGGLVCEAGKARN